MSPEQTAAASVPSLLQPLKDRLAAATRGPWGSLPDTYRAIPIHRVGSDATGADVAQVMFHGPQDAADALFISHAPTDQAKLIAAIEAIDSLVDEFEESSEGFGLDLQDDDFERGWHGARRETVAMILAALTQALGGDTA